MKGKLWSEEEIEILRKEFPTHKNKELEQFFTNRSEKAIRTMGQNLKLKKINPKRHYTAQEIEEIKMLFPNTSNRELAEKYHCSIDAICGIQRRYKLRKSEEHVAKMYEFTNDLLRNCNKGWFKKGHVSLKIGKPMSKEHYEKLKPTFFTKGIIPLNYKPVGTEILREDGYIVIKIADPDVWQLKQRYVYEQHFGSIPEQHRVYFKNRNRQDCRIENLEIRAYKISTRRHYPKEIKKAIRTLNILNKIIKKTSNENSKY